MTNEEFEKELKRIEQVVTELRNKLLESKVDKKPYEVEVPEDIENYYYVDEIGSVNLLSDSFVESDYDELYKRGLAFKTKEEAEQFDKERILINKLKDRAKKYNGGWKPNWNEMSKVKYFVEYNNYTGNFFTDYYSGIFTFSKLPLFKTEEIAQQFIKEFGDEIKEVLC